MTIRGPTIAENSRPYESYYKNPMRTAWTIVLAAFVTFCLLLILIPLGVRSYVISARTTLPAMVTSINGTVLAESVQGDSPVPILLGNQLEVEAFTIISTDEGSLAVLDFFDQSDITLYSNTTLIIRHSSKPRFGLSPEADLISVELLKGRIRATPSNSASGRTFSVTTLQEAEAILDHGSYALEVNGQQTQVTTRAGSAEITAREQTVFLAEGELTIIGNDQAPTPPDAAEQNLLVNGDFSLGFSQTWLPEVFIPPNSADIVTATVRVVEQGSQSVLEFRSRGEDNIHSDAAVVQVVDKDVRDFQSLRINADILLQRQSLAGGGFIGTEFPIMINLSYKDADGNDREWYQGFYYQTPPDNYILYNDPNNDSELISQNLWFPYESENLLAILGDIKPVYVRSIRIYASGWIYRAGVTDVELLAED